MSKKSSEGAGDAFDKTHGARKRAGHAVERAAKAVQDGAPRASVALEFTVNKKNRQGIPFDSRDIEAFEKLYAVCGSGPGISTKQAKRLIQAERQIRSEDGTVYPAATPEDHPTKSTES